MVGFNVSRVGPNLYDYLLLRLVLVDCRSSLAIKLQVIQKVAGSSVPVWRFDCCFVCISTGWPLRDYHFGSTCIRLTATGVLIYVLTKIYELD
ncbi:hypothetical protein EMCRGX_G004041 [Ephydatia muelleri]